MYLETERLKIVSFYPNLFIPVFRLFCENETVMQSTFKGKTFSKKELFTLLANDFILEEKSHVGFVCILDKASGDFVGITGLLPCDFLGNENDLEFGFILHQNYWGKGLATEIGQCWIGFAQNELKLDRILAATSSRNSASRHVIEKLGLKLVKEINTKNRGSRLVFSKKINL